MLTPACLGCCLHQAVKHVGGNVIDNVMLCFLLQERGVPSSYTFFTISIQHWKTDIDNHDNNHKYNNHNHNIDHYKHLK